MTVERKRTITQPCPQCSCIQKHELEPVPGESGVMAATCMECGQGNGKVVELE